MPMHLMMDTLIDTMEKDQADKTLAGEIEDLVEFKYCKTSRGSHLVPFEIVTEYTLEKNGKGLKVKKRMKLY